MSFNGGTGIYTLPAGNPVVTQTVIQSSWANTTMTDIETALNACYYAGGVKAATGPYIGPANTNPVITWAGKTTSGLSLVSIAANAIIFRITGEAQPVLEFDVDTTRTPRNKVSLYTDSGGVAGGLVGYMGYPVGSHSADYNLVYGDIGGCLHHPAADANIRTFTIPNNATCAWPLGTELCFVNGNSGVNLLIANNDTMRLAGAGTTGTRTLAANGVAKAIKIAATEWIISGTNLT